MSTMDIIQAIGVILTTIISIIALFQANKSNQISKKSNQISKRANDLSIEANQISKEANQTSKEANVLSFEANRDTQKEYMPVIRFADNLQVKKKDVFELSNEITFDFIDIINDKIGYLCLEKFKCISVTIENIGKGIVTAIAIDELMIERGNETFKNHDEEIGVVTDELCYFLKKISKRFILNSGDKTEINFLVSDYEDLEDMDDEPYNEIEKQSNDIMLTMSFSIGSLNAEEEYYENNLMAVYGKGRLKYSSFEKLQKKNDI